MTYKELLEQLNNLNDDELEQEVAVISYNVNDGLCTTEVQLGDFEADEPDELFIGAWFEEEDVPVKPHMNPNVAETVSYECTTDPTFRSKEVLIHQASVRWNSGKSFKCHAPERVELRIGGTSYEYRAV